MSEQNVPAVHGSNDSRACDTLLAEDSPALGRSVLHDALELLLADPVLDAHRPGEALPASWFGRLADYLQALYGVRVCAKEDRDEAADAADAESCRWRTALGGCSAAGLRAGIARLSRRSTPPTLHDLLHLCSQRIDPYAAWLEAIEGIRAREAGETGRWSHPAVYRASVAVGAFDLKARPYAQIKRRWEAALAAELAAPHDEPVPPVAPPRQAGEESCPPLPPDAARRMVKELRATLTRTQQEQRDHKRWARRIQSRIADGDDSVTGLQAQVARRALDP